MKANGVSRVMKANSVRAEINGLVRSINQSWFDLAALLECVRQEQLHKELEYTRFEDYVRTELPFGPRKAFLLLQIHRRYVTELGFSKRELERVVLSKAIAALPVINQKNARIWYEKMLETTYPEFKRAIMESRGKLPNRRTLQVSLIEAKYNRVMRVMGKLKTLGFRSSGAQLYRMAELAEKAL